MASTSLPKPISPPLLRSFTIARLVYKSRALLQGPYVSIVGTRIPSNYGKRMGREIAFDLAQRGFLHRKRDG